MSPSTAKLIELVMIFGLALGLGIWQLVSVNRELRRDREREAAQRREREGQGKEP
jgi:hypothetical protein